MAKTSVKSCACAHPSQDSIYGKGQRLHNMGGGAKATVSHKCTVCGSKK